LPYPYFTPAVYSLPCNTTFQLCAKHIDHDYFQLPHTRCRRILAKFN
ncbi:35258_t:CDS:1, partial [Racocetra persica]